ncbi:MAG: PAS domain-containing protein [Ferruginibacter sp.]|nr:PAS domain-containing protein [Ferruginibacter sp.]
MLQANKDAPKILSDNLFPVVGVGASAGGLEAFKLLVKAIPENSGTAYILVQHLDPFHESILADILQRLTNIPVLEITDNITVAPDHIYIIPSNKILVATDGVLKLDVRPPKPEKNMPVDIFFTSLAEVHQEHAIGVVLSGTGTDGTLGLKIIKEHGGITFAQQLESAHYDGMPLSAIQSDNVDFVLTPDQIPGKLLELGRSLNIFLKPGNEVQHEKENTFKQILILLKAGRPVDFTYYKQSAVRRCILRRMIINKIENLGDYSRFLEDHITEQEILYSDLFFPLTSFFRDSEIFDNLCETVFPDLVKNKSLAEPLRIWIAGCSTGEEAYSVAICISEFLANNDQSVKIQLFATDISEKAITKARSGNYMPAELENVSANRLHEFFDKTNGHYQVKKPIRDMCVFATHNFLKDPPFARMDLISCRNVLIYMDHYLQKKALATFHYALNNTAFLQLGKSETTDQSPELFTAVNNAGKLYFRNEVPRRFMPATTEQTEKALNRSVTRTAKKEVKKDDFQKITDEILLSGYTPAGVVVNQLFDIVQFRGSTGPYLEQRPGAPGINVIKLARDGLAFELRNLLYKVKALMKPLSKEDIPVENGERLVSIEVIPLLDTIEIHFLILFKNSEGTRPVPNTTVDIKAGGLNKTPGYLHLQQLEKELSQVREDMRRITEEQEAANEELQSANEELLSGSEELQSVNEELETSKEEIQSTFEELIIVNRELYERNQQYNDERQYSQAIVKTIRQPLLVLTKELSVKSTNSAFYKTFKVTEPETEGKLLNQLGERQWDIPALTGKLKNILNHQSFEDFEVSLTFPVIGEKTMSLNASQMFNENSSEQLILLAIEDITEKKALAKKEQEFARILLNERRVLHDFFMQTPAFLCILRGPQHIFEMANPLYMELTGNRNILGKPFSEALPELKEQGFAELLDKVYETGESFTGKEMQISIDRGKGTLEPVYLNFNYKALINSNDEVEGILFFAYDVSEQIFARRQVEANAALLQNMYMNAPAFICTLSGPELIYELVNPAYQQLFGRRVLLGKPLTETVPELKDQRYKKMLDKVYYTGEIFVNKEFPCMLARDENSVPELRYFNFTYQPMYDDKENIHGILVFGYEVTEEIRGRKLQAENAAERIAVLEAIPQCGWTAHENGGFNYVNKFFVDYTGMTEREIQLWDWIKVVHNDQADETLKKYKQLIQKRNDFDLEFLMKRNLDDSYRWHLLRALAIRDHQSGMIISWVGTITDIHDQTLFAEVLEKQVAERTKSLKISNAELEHSNKNLEQFAYIASHDLQEPLRKIQIFSSMLNDHFADIPEKAKELINKINSSSERMTVLIKDVLNFSKLTMSEFTLEKTDLNEILNAVVSEFDLLISQKNVVIHTDKLPVIEAVPLQMKQLFYNLVSNSIKFSAPGRNPVITISCRALPPVEVKKHAQLHPELAYCELILEDNGIGFDQQFAEKIFLIFQRLHSRHLYAGTGIGLALCNNIVINHQGAIYAEAIENKGAAFHILLPLQQSKIAFIS